MFHTDASHQHHMLHDIPHITRDIPHITRDIVHITRDIAYITGDIFTSYDPSLHVKIQPYSTNGLKHLIIFPDMPLLVVAVTQPSIAKAEYFSVLPLIRELAKSYKCTVSFNLSQRHALS